MYTTNVLAYIWHRYLTHIVCIALIAAMLALGMPMVFVWKFYKYGPRTVDASNVHIQQLEYHLVSRASMGCRQILLVSSDLPTTIVPSHDASSFFIKFNITTANASGKEVVLLLESGWPLASAAYSLSMTKNGQSISELSDGPKTFVQTRFANKGYLSADGAMPIKIRLWPTMLNYSIFVAVQLSMLGTYQCSIRIRRYIRYQCTACGHDIEGSRPVCPECGSVV